MHTPVLLPCLLCLLLLLSHGCSSKPEECYSLACLKQAQRVEIAKACRADLSRHSWASRKEREAINQRYRYPYSNHDTYAALNDGGLVSPAQWCRVYAKAMVR